ncbi:hypothetical protein BJ912DRAFT_1013138 [Pholiota molesta]|nr:hypothetical protein BJ912DRAFT_1013138 [Pholiota molesta]
MIIQALFSWERVGLGRVLMSLTLRQNIFSIVLLGATWAWNRGRFSCTSDYLLGLTRIFKLHSFFYSIKNLADNVWESFKGIERTLTASLSAL